MSQPSKEAKEAAQEVEIVFTDRLHIKAHLHDTNTRCNIALALDAVAQQARDKAWHEWHAECEKPVKAEWLKVKPDRDSQRLRSEISMRFPDDVLPDWAWDLLDIGIQLGRALKSTASGEGE